MSKRLRTNDNEKCERKRFQLENLIDEIVQSETDFITNMYNSKIDILNSELNNCKQVISALEYKSDWYEKAFINSSNHEKELTKKVDYVYCVSCDDIYVENIVCGNGHANCSSCLSIGIKSYVSNQTYDTMIPKCIKCNMVLEDEKLCTIIDTKLWGEFISERTRMITLDEFRKNNKNNSLVKPDSEQFLLKRPCCGRVIIDFEGCCALKCEYCINIHYCAFCFNIFDNSDSCHQHVQKCDFNPESSYHIISELQVEAIKQCWKNRLLGQLSEHFDFDVPDPVYKTFDFEEVD